MTDPGAAGGSLFAALIAWVTFRWWWKAYRTGILNDRWGPANRATNPISYWLSMSYGAVVWLGLAMVSAVLMLMALGVIDGRSAR